MGVDLSIGERVHVTGKSLGFLKICWYLYGYITINNFMEHEHLLLPSVSGSGTGPLDYESRCPVPDP